MCTEGAGEPPAPSLLWLLDGTARSHDLLLGRTRDLVDRDGELHGDVAVAQNLDLLVLPNRTLGDQVADGDVSTLGVELRELLQVHDLVLDAERVLEPAQLRGAHVQRHLPTLETDANGVASLGALGSTTGGLTLRALTTADASLGGVGSGDGTQVVHLQHAGTRCRSIRLRRSLLGSRLLGGSLSLGVGRSGLGRSLLRGGLVLGGGLGGCSLLRGLLGLDGLVLLSH